MMSSVNLSSYFKLCHRLNKLRVSECLSGARKFYSKLPELGNKDPKHESPLKNLLDDAASFEDLDPKSPDDVWASRAYPNVLRTKIAEETGVDPSETSIILFPGQGTQYPGMGQELQRFPKAREVYEIANEVLGFDLLKLTTQEEVDRHAQVSVVVNSMAALERLREERASALPSCVATAGFSLGEITALIFAGAIPFEQGLKLVSIRAAAMEAASRVRPGGMLTVMYAAAVNIRQACAEALEHCVATNVQDPYCTIANYLYPHCKVIAGCPEALKFLEDNGAKLGIRRTKRLRVSGAFHSVGVEAAVEPFQAALNLCDVQMPEIRVLSSVNGKEYKSVNQIRKQLPKQIIQPVKWEQLMQNIYLRPQGVAFPRTFEVGPGNSLRAILRQINAQAWDNSFSIAT